MSFMPKTRGGFLWRALLGCVLVVAFAAGTTAVAGLLQVKNIVSDLNLSKALSLAKGVTVLPKPGAPETLLLIGSDHREGQAYNAASTDTMMLVRIDDSSDTINLLSVPRDLEVLGPGGSDVKLNALYSTEGGPGGLIKGLKAQVFPGLKVNHVLDLNFIGFSDLIDAIGCVYTDVDHRYYNVSTPYGADNYSSIDIQPGYQKLCGGVHSATGTNSALAFVRFRHTDSDEVRNARQQDFIRWAKDGYSSSQLLSNQGTLLKIFGRWVQTDRFLHSTDGLLELFDLIINADKLTLKTIHFPEYFGACGGNSETPCYVYPCPELSTCPGYAGPNPTIGTPTPAEEAAYQEFITPTHAKTVTATTPTTTTPTKRKAKPKTVSVAGLTADPGDGKSQAGQLGNVGFPVYYPSYVVGGYGAGYCFSLTGNCDDGAEPATAYAHSYPRKYAIHGYGNARYKAYVMTLVINAAEGWYYTVQGTTWQDPPILRSPSKIVTADGKRLEEYDDGGNISLIAYHTPRGVYWVSNTLDNHIPNGEMLALAANLTKAVG